MEITKDKALEMLKLWHHKGTTVALWFAAKGGTAMSAMQATITGLSATIVFRSETSLLSFALYQARFEYGPLEFMRFPLREGLSQINGLHIYLESGHRLFVCDDRQQGQRWMEFVDAMLKSHRQDEMESHEHQIAAS